MTHDPYQTYSTFSAYPAVTNPGQANPFGSPYTAMQTSAINPAAAYNPLFAQQPGSQGIQGIPGMPNYGGITSQQLQLAAALASQGGIPQLLAQSQLNNPWQNQFTNPWQNQQNQFANPWQNQFAGAFQNPLQNPQTFGLQNPLLAAALQNPLVAAAIQQQNPLLNPVLAQFGSPYGAQMGFQGYSPFQQPVYSPHHQQMGNPLAALGQQISPFAQFNSPGAQFNPTLAPQSWVGQGLAGQVGQIGAGYGQVNPLLAQLAARTLQGASPWAAF